MGKQVTGTNNPSIQVSKDVWNKLTPDVMVGDDGNCNYITDGAADDVQIAEAITEVAYKGKVGFLPNKTYVLANPIEIAGLGSDEWDPVSQIELAGFGNSTIIDNAVNSANQHCIVLSNEAQVNMHDLRIQATQGHCIFGADTGAIKESAMRSYIGEVYLKCYHASYAGMYMKNPFWNQFGYVEVNSAGDGVVFDATDTAGINPNGNSDFRFLMCNATGSGKYGLTLKALAATGLVYMNFHRIEMGGSTANMIKLSVDPAGGAGQITDNFFEHLFLEGGAKKILIDSGASSGSYPHIDKNYFQGYMDCTSGATSIDASAAANNHGGNRFDMDCWLDAADSVILNDKGTWYHGVSEYNLRIFGNATLAAAQIVLGGASPKVRWTAIAADGSPIKNPNSGATATVADGGTIAHSVGLEPTWAHAQCSVSGEICSITAKSATTLTVAIKKISDGSAGTTQTIYWRAGWNSD